MSGGGGPQETSRFGEPLVTADDVARHLGVDRATVYRLAGRPGGIPVIEVAPRVRRFRVSDVLAFVAAKTVKPPPRSRGGRHLFGGAA